MKKKVLIFSGIIILVLIAFVGYKLATFSIFDTEFKELKTIKIPNSNSKLIIYHLPSNASSQDFIQIRKIENQVETVIENFENYDLVNDVTFKNDSILKIIIGKTTVNKTDTIELKIK
jgi:hypothetical protein